MLETLTDGLLPSAAIVLAAAGGLLVVIVTVLVQKATRAHLAAQRCDQLRKRVSRVEARWPEAAL